MYYCEELIYYLLCVVCEGDGVSLLTVCEGADVLQRVVCEGADMLSTVDRV